MKFRTVLTILVPVFGIFFLLNACKQEPGKAAEAQATETGTPSLNWILGFWKIEGQEGGFEEWTMVHDSLYRGKGGTINGKDTVLKETIELMRKGEKWWYMPTVTDQNNGQPVYYRLEDLTEKSFGAYNAQHDFPKEIHYSLVNPGEIHAVLAGSQEKPDSVVIVLKKP